MSTATSPRVASVVAHIVAVREDDITDAQDIDWYLSEESGLDSHDRRDARAALVAHFGF